MRVLLANLAIIALTMTSAHALQQPAAPKCPEREAFFELPVDEYVAQADKERKKRNTNPLPDNFCLGGWCRGRTPKPPKPSEPATEEEKASAEAEVVHETRPAPSAQSSSRDVRPAHSSSRDTRADTGTPGAGPLPRDSGCDLEAVKRDLAQTIKDVEVGDFYLAEKKYRAALSRFEDANARKPNDAAIQLRLARTLEKLDQREEALSHYRAVAASGWEGPGVDEAKTAVTRLTSTPANPN